MPPRLSLILCSRNDQYMGNSLWRLETTLNYTAARVAAIGRTGDVEILVSDWGSDRPLRDVARLTPDAAALVSFITVPPDVARARQGDSPFPEVLALNAAARRASGAFIGRIDQDTLVGERFLRWFFDTVEATADVLFFANRRDIPYHFVSASPALASVTRFIRWFGDRRPVWTENPATGDVFWTASVGIWLVHRRLWWACGGYDERLIYYNWMETDMICRLRQHHAVVDLGALTGQAFYHLEHFHPRAAWLRRLHERKNAPVNLSDPPRVLHPNPDAWGLNDVVLVPERGRAAPRQPGAGPGEPIGFAGHLLRLGVHTVLDRGWIAWAARAEVWGRRLTSLRAALADEPVSRWPLHAVRLWRRRAGARVRAQAGLRSSVVGRVAAAVLCRVGLLGVARRMRLRVRLATDRELRRRERDVHARASLFGQAFADVLGARLGPQGGTRRTALVVSSRCPTVEGELCTIKALQLAGFSPVVLLEDEQRALRAYYELAGVDRVYLWSEFLSADDHWTAAAAIVDSCRTTDGLLGRTHDGVRVGLIAVCTALRRLRLGTLEFRAPGVRDLLVRGVAASLSAMGEAGRMLDTIRPALVLTDVEYTPKGELFETCLARSLEVVAYDTAHTRQALLFKRYRPENRDDHLTTLSAATWAALQRMPWTPAHREVLVAELASGYRSGTWYDTPWTSTDGVDRTVAVALPGLDRARKTAVIFPHMLWDAPVMWGQPLFTTYQEWLLETVAAACRNTAVNWVIKIHPAHVWKQADEGYRGEPAEVRVLREQLGPLPAHVSLLPPDTPLSTWSLFGVMDYCLTVRGTVGVEAASFGIPVLTAGPARYSGRGFTVDSASRDEYLARVAAIQEIPRLSDAQRTLAERFAYGLFLLRPLPLHSVSWDPAPGAQPEGSPAAARVTVRTTDEWRTAADVGRLAAWLASRDEDLLGRDGEWPCN